MTTLTLITCASGYDTYLMEEGSFLAWREEDIEHQGLQVGDIYFDVDSKYVSQERDAEGKVFFMIKEEAKLTNIKEVGVDIYK